MSNNQTNESKIELADDDASKFPEKTDAHIVNMPHIGVKKIRTKKDLINKSLFYRLGSYLLRGLVVAIFYPIFWIRFKLKVKNSKYKKLVKKKGVVLVANHCHIIDCVFTAALLWPRNFYITSIAENFKIPVLGTLVKALRAIPIPTDIKGMRYFKEVVNELLQEKKMVMFYPEGALWPHYRELRPFKTGAFNFAANNNTPVLPLVMNFTAIHKSLKKTRYKVRFAYLPPEYPDENLDGAKKVNELTERVHDAMELAMRQDKANVKHKDVYTKRYLKQLEKQKSKENEKNEDSDS